jgi:hypothetical protein
MAVGVNDSITNLLNRGDTVSVCPWLRIHYDLIDSIFGLESHFVVGPRHHLRGDWEQFAQWEPVFGEEGRLGYREGLSKISIGANLGDVTGGIATADCLCLGNEYSHLWGGEEDGEGQQEETVDGHHAEEVL